ncbi:MAG: helix-turn-helix domain-containing protein [Faecousia sp.]
MVEKLKLLRWEHGVSQREVAEAVGVSQQSINKYENHAVEPDIATLIALADYFHTSVDYLIGYTEIDRIIEPVSPGDLNEEEAVLISQWRRLNEKERESLRMVIANYIGGN